MTTCKRSTELISKQMDEKLTRRENVALRLHLVICAACRAFASGVQLIRSQLRKSEGASAHMNEKKKHELLRRISEEFDHRD